MEMPQPLEHAFPGQAAPQRTDPLIGKYLVRIKQLQNEILSRQEENELIVAENLRQNEALREFNTDLENKIKLRTWELEVSKHNLELQNQRLQELHQTKESLMHMIVHDMKNPLTCVLGILNYLQDVDLQAGPEISQLLDDGHLQGKKLLSMIEEILLVSRMQSKEFTLKKQHMDLAGLIHDCVSMMSKTVGIKHLRLVFEPAASKLMIHADPSIVERVVNNLLNNAIKYAPTGSDILVSAEKRIMALVSVTNWGEVIPAQFHTKIFDLFCRVKSDDTTCSGTGLGLTFTKLAIEAHGGEIQVESPVLGHDHGARFFFTLPIGNPEI